jgi:hypothetical protein
LKVPPATRLMAGSLGSYCGLRCCQYLAGGIARRRHAAVTMCRAGATPCRSPRGQQALSGIRR